MMSPAEWRAAGNAPGNPKAYVSPKSFRSSPISVGDALIGFDSPIRAVLLAVPQQAKGKAEKVVEERKPPVDIAVRLKQLVHSIRAAMSFASQQVRARTAQRLTISDTVRPSVSRELVVFKATAPIKSLLVVHFKKPRTARPRRARPNKIVSGWKSLGYGTKYAFFTGFAFVSGGYMAGLVQRVVDHPLATITGNVQQKAEAIHTQLAYVPAKPQPKPAAFASKAEQATPVASTAQTLATPSMPTVVVWGHPDQLRDEGNQSADLATDVSASTIGGGKEVQTVKVYGRGGTNYNLDIASPQSLWYVAGAKYGVDPLLIYSVALVESRSVMPGGQVAPTPWMVRIDGDVVIKQNSKDVSQAIVNAMANDQAVQDVGLMQVFWPMHRDLAPDPVKLIDPATNIDIGTQILAKGLRESTDPVMAVGYYHSHSMARAKFYGIAVYMVYHRLQKVLDRASNGNLASAQVSAIPEAHLGANM